MSVSATSRNTKPAHAPSETGATGIASALSRYFEASLYLMLYTSVLTLISTGKLDLFTTIAAPAILVLKGFRRWRGLGPEISSRLATSLMAGYFLIAPVDYLLARNRAADAPNPALYGAMIATVHLLLFAMMVRLYSARERRDYLFLAMIGFACMLAAAVLTVDTTYLAFFLVFLALGISTFIGLEMQRGAEGAAPPSVESNNQSAKRLVRALGVTSGIVALSALVLGGVIFFALPRFTAGYFASYSLRPKLMTGFTDSVELGQIGEIQKSSEVVMRVKVDGGPAKFMNQRWRGVALTRFDGWRWSGLATERRHVYSNSDGWFVLSGERVTSSSAFLHYTVLLEPVASNAVFVAPGVTAVRGRFAAASGLGDAPRRSYLLLDSAGSIFNPFPNFTDLSYDAYSLPSPATPTDLRASGNNYPTGMNETYLQVPVLDARIPALAQQVTAAGKSPYDKAVMLQSYLQTRYAYTLDQGNTAARDPLADFLFVRRAGHCEYFASAMTIMLRTLGIPARYINGFQTGEYNDVGGDFIVRASDAHSWVEVYFPGHGWITFDPTPAGEAGPRGWFAGVAKYLDWFQLQWGEWVINYDFLHQITLGQGVGRTSRQWASGTREHVGRLYDAMVERMRVWQVHAAGWRWTKLVIVLVLLAFSLLMTGPSLRKQIARMWSLRGSAKGTLSPRRASEHYSEMLRLLARRGYRKAEGITPLEFAASIPQTELAGPVERLTNLYQAARFGEVEVEQKRSVELLREIRQQLAVLT
jgi:transglutaminase-like putative cysteine protease